MLMQVSCLCGFFQVVMRLFFSHAEAQRRKGREVFVSRKVAKGQRRKGLGYRILWIWCGKIRIVCLSICENSDVELI